MPKDKNLREIAELFLESYLEDNGCEPPTGYITKFLADLKKAIVPERRKPRGKNPTMEEHYIVTSYNEAITEMEKKFK